MSTTDWSKAPPDATHKRHTCGTFYKVGPDKNSLFWADVREGEWQKSINRNDNINSNMYEARPVDQFVVQWDKAPEDATHYDFQNHKWHKKAKGYNSCMTRTIRGNEGDRSGWDVTGTTWYQSSFLNSKLDEARFTKRPVQPKPSKKEIDWRSAPSDATHYRDDTQEFCKEGAYGSYYAWNPRMYLWAGSGCSNERLELADFIKRPVKPPVDKYNLPEVTNSGWLLFRYIRHIEKDKLWVDNVQPLIAVNNFERFCVVTMRFITECNQEVRKADGVYTTDVETAYILADLWMNAGGSYESMPTSSWARNTALGWYLDQPPNSKIGVEERVADMGIEKEIPFSQIDAWIAQEAARTTNKPSQTSTAPYLPPKGCNFDGLIGTNPCCEITLDSATRKFYLNDTETEMSNNYQAFETKHYVFGTDVSTMNEADLISAIKKVENEIANLKSVKTKSTKISAKIAELKGMLDEIVSVLDSK